MSVEKEAKFLNEIQIKNLKKISSSFVDQGLDKSIALKLTFNGLTGIAQLGNRVENSTVETLDLTKKAIIQANKFFTATEIPKTTINPSLQSFRSKKIANFEIKDNAVVSVNAGMEDLNSDGLLNGFVENAIPKTTIPSVANSSPFDPFSIVKITNPNLLDLDPEKIGKDIQEVSSVSKFKPSETDFGFNEDFEGKQIKHYFKTQVLNYNQIEAMFNEQNNVLLKFENNTMATLNAAFNFYRNKHILDLNMTSLFGKNEGPSEFEGLLNASNFKTEYSTDANPLFDKTLGDYIDAFYSNDFNESNAIALNQACKRLLLIRNGYKIEGFRNQQESPWINPTLILPLSNLTKMSFNAKVSAFTLQSVEMKETFALLRQVMSEFDIIFTAFFDKNNKYNQKHLGGKDQMLFYDAEEYTCFRNNLLDYSVINSGAFSSTPSFNPYNTFDGMNYQFACLAVNTPFARIDNRKSYKFIDNN